MKNKNTKIKSEIIAYINSQIEFHGLANALFHKIVDYAMDNNEEWFEFLTSNDGVAFATAYIASKIEATNFKIVI